MLSLVLSWAKSNVSDVEDFSFLAQLLNLIYLDRRTVATRVTHLYPEFSVSTFSAPETRRRACAKAFYLVEFKLGKSQLRNIEDFVDRGEKSMFYSFRLQDGTYNKVSELSSTSSICGTCNGNYFRPVTQVGVRENK